ncbi:hypothetical protein VB716_08570 [Synechococcus sp. CCY9201]|uniref:hypothetical protein n=1 Tax=Synechococcus sp. CCY9201 TaxID=174697 RepID=UPI002B21F40D|nr:hypothetical protein [Synechococcus sp. CCY9201]MEA5474273.1 hypothetical protein [Synechococcus sp. CCY9201]
MKNRLRIYLADAADPSTAPARLHQLSSLKRKGIRQPIRAVIAANPNVDENLLWDLAQDCSQQVVDNPVFKLLLLENDAWWKRCGTTALIRLLARMGPEAPEPARIYLLEQLVDALADLESSQRGEILWRWEEDIEITWKPVTKMSCKENDRKVNEHRQTFQICTGVDPFPGYSTLSPGDRPESACDLIELLEMLFSCAEDYVADLEFGNGWFLELEGTNSSSSLEIISIHPVLPDWGFCVSNDHSLMITDPAGLVHSISLSTDEVEESYRINSIGDQLLGSVFQGFETGLQVVDELRSAFCLVE